MKMRALAGLAIAAMLAGGKGMGFIAPTEVNRGWNGFVGDSLKKQQKHTNRLRCKHNAKLKLRKAK